MTDVDYKLPDPTVDLSDYEFRTISGLDFHGEVRQKSTGKVKITHAYSKCWYVALVMELEKEKL